jgi:hypothetical protein
MFSADLEREIERHSKRQPMPLFSKQEPMATNKAAYIVEQVKLLAELFGQRTFCRFDVFMKALDDVPQEKLEHGFAEAFKVCKYFPRPAEIRELTGYIAPRESLKIAQRLKAEADARAVQAASPKEQRVRFCLIAESLRQHHVSWRDVIEEPSSWPSVQPNGQTAYKLHGREFTDALALWQGLKDHDSFTKGDCILFEQSPSGDRSFWAIDLQWSEAAEQWVMVNVKNDQRITLPEGVSAAS